MRALNVLSIAVLVALMGCGTTTNPTASPTLPVACCTPSATASPTARPTETAAATPTAAASPTAVSSATPAESGSPAVTPSAGPSPVTLDPADFTNVIDNPYLPMTAGSVSTYRETDAEGAVAKVVVTVTNDTKEILGITTLVVHDVLTEGGVTVEDTFDWYAQDTAGNVWYFGEDTKEFSGSQVDTSGSWEAGVDGAQPGVVMPAAPQTGLSYRQEYLAGEAEDSATVLSLDEFVQVAAGSYRGLLLTKEYSAVEPDVLEYKWYAQGVGQVLALTVSGGSDREELTKFSP
jgi:hypothetical protein